MGERLLPWLAALATLLPDLAAAWPARTYFFRDFSVTFYPLRLFVARELGQGRWPSWNPYICEGSFVLPVLYPPDLLHVLLPSPEAVSWLLTLHLPLAALAAWWLARELGAQPRGAFVCAVVYGAGGLCLSSLNLYVFLQALALAPLLAGALRRAALRGGRSTVAAGLVLALALSTLAVEFVGQAVLLGLALGLAAQGGRKALGRLALATALGVGLAGVPVALTLGIVRDSVRGTGFGPDVALGNAVHPVVLLQTLVPDLFGALSAPVAAWWGGRFFSKGLPYFLSIYVGPIALVMAWVGAAGSGDRSRRVVLGSGLLGLWYALGPWGGLAPLVAHLPFAGAVRFPSKALLLPHFAVSLLAGWGADRLGRGEGWRRAMGGAAGLVAGGLALALVVRAQGPGVAAWAAIDARRFDAVGGFLVRGFLGLAVLSFVVVVVGLGVRAGRIRPEPGATVLALVLVADLARAGAGMNPQVSPTFFARLPEMAALRLDDAEGGRVFSYGLDQSPAFRRFLAAGPAHLALASFFANRQLLAPYSNVLDRVEAPEATDLTSFVPRPRELGPEDYAPARVGHLLPWLRNAGVTRVLSLDPLEHPDLEPLAVVPLGPPDLAVHAYRVSGAWPRAFVACHARLVKDADDGLGQTYAPGFDPAHEVALEGPAPPVAASCREGSATRLPGGPDEERFVATSDGPGYLVSRSSFARGWTARVDGAPADVLRANGKHRAVALPGGRHEVVLRYRAPGLLAGLLVTALAAAVAAALGARSSALTGRARS
jgi:hypothetical protein